MILSVSYKVSKGMADHCTLLNSLNTLKASWKELRATAGGRTICMDTMLHQNAMQAMLVDADRQQHALHIFDATSTSSAHSGCVLDREPLISP